MSVTVAQLQDRCRKLGLRCDDLPGDRISSALAALACFPMYMVANVHAWTSEGQFRVPLLDLPGSEHIRESFEIGKQEAAFQLAPEHRRVLGALISHARPSDLVVYEYALETLKELLPLLSPAVADTVRAAIARMIVAVARASGEAYLGTGEKISPEERACIAQIDRELALSGSPRAAEALKGLG